MNSDSLHLLQAAHFAAQRHAEQRRKDQAATPYINHPLAVATLLAEIGGITDLEVLQAALLHDTVEDTTTTLDELEQRFGSRVRELVDEVTDDKSLPKTDRKRLQIEHSPHLSHHAQQIKIADKCCNLLDIGPSEPADWTAQRRAEYLDWAERVVGGCRGCNAQLENHFQGILAQRRAALGVE